MKKTPKLKINVYRDKKREYRWNMKLCGRIVAESGEGYKRVTACTTVLCNAMKAIQTFNYEWVQLEKVLPKK